MTETLQLESPKSTVRHEYIPESREVEEAVIDHLLTHVVRPPRVETHFADDDLEKMNLPNPKYRRPVNTPVVLPHRLIRQ